MLRPPAAFGAGVGQRAEQYVTDSAWFHRAACIQGAEYLLVGSALVGAAVDQIFLAPGGVVAIGFPAAGKSIGADHRGEAVLRHLNDEAVAVGLTAGAVVREAEARAAFQVAIAVFQLPGAAAGIGEIEFFGVR